MQQVSIFSQMTASNGWLCIYPATIDTYVIESPHIYTLAPAMQHLFDIFGS